MNYLNKIIVDFELNDVEGIKICFENGVSPNELYNNEPLIYELISEYPRTSRFKDCIKVFIDYGLEFEDKILLAVLSDDAISLNEFLQKDPGSIHKKYTLRTAFTPLLVADLLHVCAEFNHLSCAKVLVKHGADINGKAGIDEYGFGGQTPIFHAVNQHSNHSPDMLHFLLSESADLTLTVTGLIWGKGYEWETLIPAVNPISYAMMGLLPQMHRNEKMISDTVSLLMDHAYGINHKAQNIPNKYLNKKDHH